MSNKPQTTIHRNTNGVEFLSMMTFDDPGCGMAHLYMRYTSEIHDLHMDFVQKPRLNLKPHPGCTSSQVFLDKQTGDTAIGDLVNLVNLVNLFRWHPCGFSQLAGWAVVG